MARVTDPQKLEMIKRVTMEIMSESGYKDMTVSKIAKKSGVSAGYLYRHFEGKDDLISHLVDEYFELFNRQLGHSLSESSSFEEIVHLYTTTLIEMANEDPVPIKFLGSLMSDHSFHKSRLETDANAKIREMASRVISNRTKTGELRQDMDIVDFVLFFIEMPLNYVNMRLNKAFNSEDLNTKEADKITDMITKALS